MYDTCTKADMIIYWNKLETFSTSARISEGVDSGIYY